MRPCYKKVLLIGGHVAKQGSKWRRTILNFCHFKVLESKFYQVNKFLRSLKHVQCHNCAKDFLMRKVEQHVLRRSQWD